MDTVWWNSIDVGEIEQVETIGEICMICNTNVSSWPSRLTYPLMMKDEDEYLFNHG